MKAKTLKTIIDNGEIPQNTEVEIVDGYCGCNGYYYTCIIPDGRQINISSNLLGITDYTPYINWEQRRYEIAKAAMQGLLSNNKVLNEDVVVRYRSTFEGDVAHSAVKYANALIDELKKK